MPRALAPRPLAAQAESACAPPAALRARSSAPWARRLPGRLRAPHPAPQRAQRTMPQLDSGGGGAGAGDDLGAPDELLAFQDEGEEQDDKNRDSAAGPERDLAELKSSLVNESEGAAAGAGVPGPGVRVPGEAEGAPEVSPARTSPEDPVPSWYRADPPPPPPALRPSWVPSLEPVLFPSAPHGPSASLCRPWDESILRSDFSRTNFQSP